MTFKLSIPGRDEAEMPTAANAANLLIGRASENESTAQAADGMRISRLAGLADIADSISARQLADDLIQAAMKVCDRHGDDETARQAMRADCLELPPHLRADLLEHFNPERLK